MDVRKNLFLISFLTFLTACSGGSSSDKPFEKVQGFDCAGESVTGEKLVKWKDGRISKISGHASQMKALEKMKGEIEFVEDNYRVSRPVQLESQVQGQALSVVPNWGAQNIHASDLWSKGVRGDGVIVAVIDSGIDRNHAQLRNQLYVNPNEVVNGIDDDGNGYVDDVNGYDFSNDAGDLSDSAGHGTHVSGIIAAEHGTGVVQGVAPGAKIMMLDFFGGANDGDVFTAIKAIRYAVHGGAKVINASWGGPGCSRSLKGVLDELSSQNVLFVAAAGNDGNDISSLPSYPAAFQVAHQITVGAMTIDGYTAGFSNYGRLVQLTAPGAGILSTFPGNGTMVQDGTSMATPFVTGAAALLYSAFPQAGANDVKNAILSSTLKGPYPVQTRGSLDVAAAYEILRQQFSSPTP